MNQKVDLICTNYAAWHPNKTSSELSGEDSIRLIFSWSLLKPSLYVSCSSGGINAKYPLLHLWHSKLVEILKSKEITKIFVERLVMAVQYTKMPPFDIWYRQMTVFLWSFKTHYALNHNQKVLSEISWILLTYRGSEGKMVGQFQQSQLILMCYYQINCGFFLKFI